MSPVYDIDTAGLCIEWATTKKHSETSSECCVALADSEV